MDKIAVEKKWNKAWADNPVYKFDAKNVDNKYYVLEMFSYPSGAKLHIGHWYNYGLTDSFARYKIMKGANVFQPMGFDAFGLPAENYAIKTGVHPEDSTLHNIAVMEEQLKNIGAMFDWDHEIKTCLPDYYKWTQWIFCQLYKHGLAYRKKAPVNWCPSCNTVLANEQVVDGHCERCDSQVVKKDLTQWFFKITDYAEELIDGLDDLDWPEKTKAMQRNWIGKSVGGEIVFDLADGSGSFKVFTTRADTLFGCTYVVLAPEHPLVKQITTEAQRAQVEAYCDEVAKTNEIERLSTAKEKTGVFTGAYAVNPVNGDKVQVWIGDYVLASYGTGAVMAVPSHDQRDFEYSIAHNIPRIQVIDGADVSEHAFEKQDYLGKGCRLINSEEFTGLTVEEAKEAITNKLVSMGVAKKTVNYHFREWIFARQRYWGEPVPVVYTEDGQIHVLDDDELPLVLPELEDYKGRNGQAPLENATEWKQYDHNGIKGKRETSTMPGSAGSSWYYFRYIDPDNDKEFANQELLKHWMPVDLYVGGPEHAVGHLMYSRIWNRFLYDKGLSPVKEPFKKLVHQGMILGENGIKMGKRFPEYVVNPSDIVRDFGADTLRLYEMFMGPLEVSKPWSQQGVEGARRFIGRVFKYFTEPENITEENDESLKKVYHQTVKKVTSDFETLGFNTAIAQMMIFMNAVTKGKCPREYAEGFIKMFSCICPHTGEELWEMLGHTGTIAFEKWPEYDEAAVKEDTVEIGIQINGKVKATVMLPADVDKDTAIAKGKEVVADKLTGTIVKEIYVPGRIINIVVK